MIAQGLAALTVALAATPPPAVPAGRAQVTRARRTFTTRAGACRFDFVYPQVSVADPVVSASLNQIVASRLLATDGLAQSCQSAPDVGPVKDCAPGKVALEAGGGQCAGWLTVGYEVGLDADGLLSILYRTYGRYSPAGEVDKSARAISFDLASGAVLAFADVFTAAALPALEQRLRESLGPKERSAFLAQPAYEVLLEGDGATFLEVVPGKSLHFSAAALHDLGVPGGPLDRLLPRSPGPVADALRVKAEAAFAHKDLARACALDQQAVTLAPENAELWAALGGCLEAASKRSEAQAADEKAATLGSEATRLQAYSALGRLGVRPEGSTDAGSLGANAPCQIVFHDPVIDRRGAVCRGLPAEL